MCGDLVLLQRQTDDVFDVGYTIKKIWCVPDWHILFHDGLSEHKP